MSVSEKLKQAMSAIDEIKETIPDGTYKKIVDALKNNHDYPNPLYKLRILKITMSGISIQHIIDEGIYQFHHPRMAYGIKREIENIGVCERHRCFLQQFNPHEKEKVFIRTNCGCDDDEVQTEFEYEPKYFILSIKKMDDSELSDEEYED